MHTDVLTVFQQRRTSSGPCPSLAPPRPSGRDAGTRAVLWSFLTRSWCPCSPTCWKCLLCSVHPNCSCSKRALPARPRFLGLWVSPAPPRNKQQRSVCLGRVGVELTRQAARAQGLRGPKGPCGSGRLAPWERWSASSRPSRAVLPPRRVSPRVAAPGKLPARREGGSVGYRDISSPTLGSSESP